jgi:hypothetical protein
MAREGVPLISLDLAVEMLRDAPRVIPDDFGALRAYVGAILDRLSVHGGIWAAREVGVRNPTRTRQRLERQIVDVLAGRAEGGG